MVSPNRRQRPGRILFWLIAGLTLIFVALAAYHLFMRFRDSGDAALLAELSNAVILEDPLPARPSDWPQFRGLRRDGVSPETNLLSEWPSFGLKVVWKSPCGEGFSAVTVSNGRAFTLSCDEDRTSEIVHCWTADTGDELWSREYDCNYSSPNGSGPRASPTVEGDFVYTVGATGILNCLEVRTGNTLWRHDLLTEFGAKNLQWGMSFSPLIEGDLVLTNPGGRKGNSLAAFDKRTGDLRWQALDDPAGYSSPIAITAAGVRQAIFFTGDNIVSVSPLDGTLFWRKSWNTSYGVNAATPLAFQATVDGTVNDYVFISSGYGKGCALLKIVKNGDRFDVRSVYENGQMCNHFSSSVRLKDHIYGFNESMLVCMELRTGKMVWEQQGFNKGSLILVDGKLLILGERGNLSLAEATPDGYQEISKMQVFRGDQKWTAPVVANGKLYLRDRANVICLDLRGHAD
jgi:outer membrane protein assembly factor BamB